MRRNRITKQEIQLTNLFVQNGGRLGFAERNLGVLLISHSLKPFFFGGKRSEFSDFVIFWIGRFRETRTGRMVYLVWSGLKRFWQFVFNFDHLFGNENA